MLTTGTETILIQDRCMLNFIEIIKNTSTNLLGLFSIILGIFSLNNLSASDAIYIKPKAYITTKDIYLSNISKLPDGIADILLTATPREPVTLTPDEIFKLLPS
ncbi:MAG: hypothetical protein EBS19_12215, partial [Spirochaetia bacterium]|nr:hypothetical protein [Spirochaetia bacterium]